MTRIQNIPTNSELEVLTILWEQGKQTAREVHNILSTSKNTGYTTTLKTIQNMFDKGFVNREPKGQTHLYFAALKQQEVQKSMLGGFVNRVFGGSSKQLVLQVLGNQNTSQEELEEIRQMLDELERKGGQL